MKAVELPAGKTTAPAAALETKGLCVQYGFKIALRDVSIAFPARSVTAIIGPSGCGKTSLLTGLNRLTDLIPGCRVSGSVQFDDIDVHSPATDVIRLRRRVGMIFQKPNPFPLSVWRNLELPLREHGTRDRAEIAARIEATLRDVGLWDDVKDRLQASALAFSGGQQQRICLARALVLRPEVLLLDEPCSALDPLSTGVIEDLLQRLKERHALVLVTHNLAQARRVADHTAVLWDTGEGGTLIEHGGTTAVFEGPSHPMAAAYVHGRVG